MVHRESQNLIAMAVEIRGILIAERKVTSHLRLHTSFILQPLYSRDYSARSQKLLLNRLRRAANRDHHLRALKCICVAVGSGRHHR
jgi:hypothetical protein